MRRLAVAALLLLAGPALAEPSAVLRGQHAASPALGRDLTFDLYLPADRDRLGLLPVIYLLHGTDSTGADWLDKGGLEAVADRLIATRAMPAALIVMPDGGNSWYVDSPLPAGLGAMGTAVAQDLPDWIEAHYPVRAAREARAIGGYSMGGFGALRAALAQPDRFVAAAVMSGAFWAWLRPDSTIDGKLAEATRTIFAGAFGDPFDPSRFVAESPLTLAQHLPADAPRPAVLMICGRNEVFHMREEQEAAERILPAAGIPLRTGLTDGDHDWDNWRGMLPGVLEFLGRHLEPGVPKSAVRRQQEGHSHS